MQDFLLIILFSLLPAAGNLSGALLAESVSPPRWIIGAALHGAAGVAIALVSIELTPFILSAISVWLFAAAFFAGAGASLLLTRGVFLAHDSADPKMTRAIMVYAVIGADLFADGLMTRAGGAVALKLGFLLAGAQLFANMPGGFAAAGTLKHYAVARRTRIIAAVAVAAPALVSAILGYAAFRGAGLEIRAAALSFIVGVLLLATIEDMAPEGDAPRPPRWSSTLSFAAGFTMMAIAAIAF